MSLVNNGKMSKHLFSSFLSSNEENGFGGFRSFNVPLLKTV